MSLSSTIFVGGLLALVVAGSYAFVQDPYNAPVPYHPRALVASSSVTNPSNHLELRLTLNATMIKPAEAVNVTISEFNSLAQSNNVTRSNDWPLQNSGQGFGIGPCGTLNEPMGVAVFGGYYTASNISAGRALDLYAILPYFCPMILPVTSYNFAPSATSAEIGGVCVPPGCLEMNALSSVSVSGYWESGGAAGGTFHPLSVGTYTVAGGDEWGSLTLLYFVVV